ncbi:Agamous-like MADS-box protein AGL8-like protein [Hibiscus syriacus]|uniref:Agamous-like MADS-box protein AGL8-like protein n=1 Tax=Hibiscus syriacus TaxID=106335 RepID=A0A6A2Y6M6_HIBSY|nr:Agamous-like MADS-box protein AGL8-like protein [Hibiscus syriacus]
MDRILERYEQKSYAARQLAPTGKFFLECSKLTSTVEALQRNLRQFQGEGLDTLSLRDLQLLEQQIGNSLKRIRTRKNKLMNESISLLQKRERTLHDQNNILAKKVKTIHQIHEVSSFILDFINTFSMDKAERKDQTPSEHAQNSSVQPQFPSLTIGEVYEAMEGTNKEVQFNLNLVPTL